MGWWVYLSGVLGTLLCTMYMKYHDWKKGEDVTVKDLILSLLFSATSWFAFVFLSSIIFATIMDNVIIKGKKH